MNSKVFEELLSQLKKDGSLAFIVTLVAITQFISAVSAPADACGRPQLDLRLVGFWGFVVFVSGVLCLSQRIKEGRHTRLRKTLDGLDAQFSEVASSVGKYCDPSVLKRQNSALSRLASKKQHLSRITIVVHSTGAVFVAAGLVSICMSGVSLMTTAILAGVGVLIISGGFLTAAFLPEPLLEEVKQRIDRLQKLAAIIDKKALEEGDAAVETAYEKATFTPKISEPPTCVFNDPN